MQEIEAASNEQANGTIQVNNAIQQLNSITQQSAAASVELSSNASKLADLSEKLNELMRFFDIGNVHGSSAKITPKHNENEALVRMQNHLSVREEDVIDMVEIL